MCIWGTGCSEAGDHVTQGETLGKEAGLLCQERPEASWLLPGLLATTERGHDQQLKDSCWEESLVVVEE